MGVMSVVRAAATVELSEQSLDVSDVHARHADFVWATLHRLGVREADLPDMLQEVFVVVHRRGHTFDGSSRLTTWLFGICLRVATAYRRRAHIRREQLVEHVPEEVDEERTPEEVAAARRAQAQLERILDSMELEQRAVFVMFEVEEMPCAEIASVVGIPVGTVHSRLHAARKSFERTLARLQAADRRGGAR